MRNPEPLAHHYVSHIGLLGPNSDQEFWELAKPLLPELSDFYPIQFWRHETTGNLWEANLFASDDNGRTENIFFDARSVPSFRGIKPSQEVPSDGSLLSTFTEYVRQDLPAGLTSRIAIMVNRPYDAAQRYFQLKIIADQSPEFSPEVIIRPEGNCFWIDEMVPNARVVDRMYLGQLEGLDPDPNASVIQCIKSAPGDEYKWRGELRQKIRQWCADSEPRQKPDRSISILISWELEKRVFVRQNEFLDYILSSSRNNFSSVNLFVNGMTGGVDGGAINSQIDEAEAALTEKLVRKHAHVAEVVYMGGKSMQDKAALCASVDMFAAPLGTASIIPMMLGIPGIAYCSPRFFSGYSWMKEGNTILIPSEKTWAVEGNPIDRPDWAAVDDTGESYDIDMDYLKSIAAGSLSQIAINEPPMRPR